MSNFKYSLYMATLMSLISTHPQEATAQTRLGANEAGDKFAGAMATGDFNGDGLDDLAVGAQGESPGSDSQSGIIFVYQGTDAIGLKPWRAYAQASRKPNGYSLGLNEKDDQFGHSLTSGDFDGDGYDDLAVGAPGESPGNDPKSGYVFLFKGSADGLIPWASIGQDSATANGYSIGVNEDGDRFGHSLTSGDFNADGFDDLAIGAPGKSLGEDPKTGAVFLFNGSLTGLTAFGSLAPSGFNNNNVKDNHLSFGTSLAAGDFNTDGYVDLAVGAIGEDLQNDNGKVLIYSAGAVYTYKGTNTSLQPLEKLTPPTDVARPHAFGFSLATGKFPGIADIDGIGEENADWLIVGDPYADDINYEIGNYHLSGAIYAYAYRKRDSTFNKLPFQTITQSHYPAPDYTFGYSVLVYDSQIVVGAPAHGYDNYGPEGVVFYAHPSKNSAGLFGLSIDENNISSDFTGFGVSLAAGDFSGVRDKQLVVGAPHVAYKGQEASGWAFVYEDISPFSPPIYTFGQ